MSLRVYGGQPALSRITRPPVVLVGTPPSSVIIPLIRTVGIPVASMTFLPSYPISTIVTTRSSRPPM